MPLTKDERLAFLKKARDARAVKIADCKSRGEKMVVKRRPKYGGMVQIGPEILQKLMLREPAIGNSKLVGNDSAVANMPLTNHQFIDIPKSSSGVRQQDPTLFDPAPKTDQLGVNPGNVFIPAAPDKFENPNSVPVAPHRLGAGKMTKENRPALVNRGPLAITQVPPKMPTGAFLPQQIVGTGYGGALLQDGQLYGRSDPYSTVPIPVASMGIRASNNMTRGGAIGELVDRLISN